MLEARVLSNGETHIYRWEPGEEDAIKCQIMLDAHSPPHVSSLSLSRACDLVDMVETNRVARELAKDEGLI